MNNDDNRKIKDYLQKDKIISDKANAVFDNFISEIRKNSVQENISVEEDKVVSFENARKKLGIYQFRRILAVAASMVIVFVGSNVYARTMGYDNIFFMIKDLTTSKPVEDDKEIFEDRDIVISYRYFQLTEDTEMQINEMEVKDNEAKLYILIKENSENEDSPFRYKIYDDKNVLMYEGKSKKELNEKVYTEVFELSNYRDDVNSVNIEVYNRNNELLKNISVDLNEQTIEAKTENAFVEKISQIELNKFLKDETEKCYTKMELKDSEIIILATYDIFYNDGKYLVKYLFMKPDKKQIADDDIENTNIYLNTVEFKVENEKFELITIETPEEFEK